MFRKAIALMSVFIMSLCAMALDATYKSKLVLVPSGSTPSNWTALPVVEPQLIVPDMPGTVSLRAVIWDEVFSNVIPDGYIQQSVVMEEFRWKLNGTVIIQGFAGFDEQATFSAQTNGMTLPGPNYVTCEIRHVVDLVDSNMNVLQMDTPWSMVGSTSITFSNGLALASLECLGTISQTSNPGDDETVFVPLLFENGNGVTVRARDAGGAPMPVGTVTWSCSGASITPNGGAAVVDTSSPALATVTATAGNVTIALNLTIVYFVDMKYRTGSLWKDFDSLQKILYGKNTHLTVCNLLPLNAEIPNDIPTWSGTFGATGTGLVVQHTYTGVPSVSDSDVKTVATNYGPFPQRSFLICDKVLGIHSNVDSNAGFTDGHAWISITTFNADGTNSTVTRGLWPDGHPWTQDNGAGSDVRNDIEHICIGDFGKYSRFYLLSPSQNSSLMTFIGTTANWSYFYTCADWAHDAVMAAVSENVSASDYIIFGTPRAIAGSISTLEASHPTNYDIPLYGSEEATSTSSNSSCGSSSSFLP